MTDVIEAALDAVGRDRFRLMDVVETVVEQIGHVNAAHARRIAQGLGLHAGDVEDMLSFYAFLPAADQGRLRIRISRTPISLMKGAAGVAHAFEQALGVTLGGVSADGRFGLDWAGDLGLADQEVAVLVNGTMLGSLTAADVPQIAAALQGLDVSGPPPAFPLSDLPQARVRNSLVQPGALLFGPVGRGDSVRAALTRTPEAVIDEVLASRLRGRGGAGFPTGMKWRLCRQAKGTTRHVVCNADEGEPGTFKDRVLLTEVPDLVLGGMTIAGYALGASAGLIYLRGEYAYLLAPLQQAIAERRRLGLLGSDILGRGFEFDIRIQLGAGAYVCGEESALIESLEGKRGGPRDRPPFPTDRGYRAEPTSVNNVETFACVARIMERGAEWFRGYGTAESSGTKLMSVAGDCAHPGVYEVPFGITVNELLDLAGAPEAAFVQIGGPSGQTVAPKDFGRRIAYEDLSTGGSTMIFGRTRDVLRTALNYLEFFAEESCGWCAPCRVGTALMREQTEKLLDRGANLADLQALQALAGTVMRTSRCGLGQTAPNPILTTMRNFPELWEALLSAKEAMPSFDLHAALGDARALRGAPADA